MREKRQQRIRALVQSSVIGTQQEMLRALENGDIRVDQSTLSRDLAELGVRKVGGRYVLSNGQGETAPPQVDYSGAVLGFVPCGPNLIVVRTAVGQAQPVALAIDAAADPAIAGTLAGDDTIFLATRNSRSQTVALRRLASWFGEKRER